MKKSIRFAALFTTVLTIAMFSFSASIANAITIVEGVEAGYDLYQVGDIFGVGIESSSTRSRPSSGDFLGIPVVGSPIGEFDFGSGPISVGNADTIVRRTIPVFADDPQTVPIEIVSLSLQSVDPVDVGGGSFFDIFVDLSSVQPPNAGNYSPIEFFGDGGDPAGAYQAQFVFNYEVHTGTPDGPIITTGPLAPGSLELLSDFSAAWSHFPQEGFLLDDEIIIPGLGGDRVIPGVNTFLNGVDQASDFFLAQDNSLRMSNRFNDDDTHLTFSMADAFPGEQPESPIFPDGEGPDGGFAFQDVTGDGGWFDPPLTSGYDFETTDGTSKFVTVGLPPFALVPDTDMSFIITSADGVATVASSGFHTFGSPVSEFTISGISPLVDGGDPLAFPVFLLFDQSTVSFTMTPIPEPSTLLMALLASSLYIGFKRRR